jgi:hypothetical protein
MHSVTWSSVIAMTFGLAALFSISPSLAADDHLIMRLTVENVSDILKEWGATDIKAQKTEQAAWSGGKKRAIDYLVFDRTNAKYVAILTACDDAGGCLGMDVRGYIPSKGPSTAIANDYNRRSAAAKVYVDEAGYVSERYLIIDRGVQRSNILSQLDVLERVTTSILKSEQRNKQVSSTPSNESVSRGASLAGSR